MANPINATLDYFRSSAAELKKVSWPSKDMTIRYSATVIAVCIALALFFGALDLGFSKLVSLTLARTAATSAGTETPTAPVTPDVAPSADVQTSPSVNTNDAAASVNNGIQINPTDNGPIQKK